MPPAAQAQKIIVSTEEFYDGLMEYLGNDGFFFLIMSREESARLNQDEAARNRRFADAVFKLYAAAAHFAKVSPLAARKQFAKVSLTAGMATLRPKKNCSPK